MKIEFVNDMTGDDYRELLYFNLLGRKKWFRYVFTFMLICSAGGVLCGILQVIEKDYFFYASLTSLVMIAVFYFQIEGISKRFEKNETFKNGFCRPFTVDNEGVKSPISDGSIGCVSWEMFSNGYETAMHFLFYIGARQAITLVKRSMSPEQSQQIRHLAQEKLQSKFDLRTR